MNDLQVHWWPIDKPIPCARNSRKIPEHRGRNLALFSCSTDQSFSSTLRTLSSIV